MPKGFLVKRHFIDTLPTSTRPSNHEDYISDHSTSSEDIPTDLSKRHFYPPAIIHPYPPLPSTLFQPHLDFHSLVVERLHRYDNHFYQQDSSYPSEYFLPSQLYHPRPILPPNTSGGLLLDLTIKASTPITPPATPSPVSAPPSTKKSRESESSCITPENIIKPKAPITSPNKRIKAVRRLQFDEDKSSPVSGTIIKELNADDPPLVVRKGDIDPAFNVVEVTEEAKAELAKIENKIGDYICKLCCEMYDDAFTLAQHRCSRIVHVEYRCPECDKVFNCPANLASHRRWHKPRPTTANNNSSPVDLAVKRQQNLVAVKIQNTTESSSSGDEDLLFPCDVCHKRFRRQAYLKKHLISSHQEENAVMCAPPLPPPAPLLLQQITSSE